MLFGFALSLKQISLITYQGNRFRCRNLGEEINYETNRKNPIHLSPYFDENYSSISTMRK